MAHYKPSPSNLARPMNTLPQDADPSEIIYIHVFGCRAVDFSRSASNAYPPIGWCYESELPFEMPID